ncbi:VRR-NUC domain protein [Cellulophaga phage phi46:1]|uniref:VRR-NUC domain protein n=1 Tax=Cellulophaga phage phi46:1 TaxID=1327974 RepID=UPI0003515A0B|nr:VRR-NUC domain protein [Cellulophaga phage phi46:1]AGO47848.1 VRR-NUC domain protein [Cellulophaga phage phi46:1]
MAAQISALISEARLQQDIFTKHWNCYPDERKLLFSVNNNSHNKVKGAMMKSIGVVSGVSDLIYLNPRTVKPQFIELKIESGTQQDHQKDWQQLIESIGFDYYIARSVEDFNEITGLNIK